MPLPPGFRKFPCRLGELSAFTDQVCFAPKPVIQLLISFLLFHYQSRTDSIFGNFLVSRELDNIRMKFIIRRTGPLRCFLPR